MKALSNQVVPVVLTYVCIPRIPGLKEKLSSGAKVLDVGCGSGLLLITSSTSFPNSQFIGVEIDPFRCSRRSKRYQGNGGGR